MADEKQIDKIQRLMSHPEHIRNICICAHIDHGKCIGEESRLMLNNGEVINAKELYSLAESSGEKFQETEEFTIYDTSKLDLNVFSLNQDSGNIEKKPISMAWKLKGGNMIKAKLRNGFNIRTTPEHKYIVLRENDFNEVPAQELKMGDRVVCSRKLDADTSQNLKEEILNELAKKDFYVILEGSYGLSIKERILSIGLNEVHLKLNSSIKVKSFYHGTWKNRYHIRDIINLVKIFGLNLESLYDNITEISYRNGKQKGKSANGMKLPSDFNDFFYLAGLMTGDGTNNKLVVGKKELGERFEIICKDLGINAGHRNYPGKTPELVTNHTMLQILNSIFNYPMRKKSHNVRVSKILFKASDEQIASFLQGYFDTDGCAEKGRKAVSITSVSNGMLEDLQLLLLRLGCVSIRNTDTLYLTGNSMKVFQNKIGFSVKHKIEALNQIATNITGSLVIDTMPVEAIEEVGIYMQVNNSKSVTINRILAANSSSNKLQKLTSPDICFIEITCLEYDQADTVYDFTVPDNHNFVAEGMVIHNTTFSDNLLSGAGMLSEELAGKACALDFHEDEKERGITIDAANVSMVHDVEGDEYLINLIDTPGHVDFGGDVTRAMRAVDGAVTLCCAVEGIMPQTETVLRQALRERVRPVLFINKVDRLIREVKLTPEQMVNKFTLIIAEINRLIESIAPEEYKEKWKVNVQDGSVAFGSAFQKWALSFPYMQKTGITFKEVIEAVSSEDAEKIKDLSHRAPLHKVILNMSIKHHPDPRQAAAYRVPKLWHGDLESDVGKALINCDPNGPIVFVATKIVMDKHAGEIVAGRLFSGTVRIGEEVYLNMAKKDVRLQQVSVYKGAQRVSLDNIPAGNIIGLVGLKGVFSGETVSSVPVEPFEAIKHIFEPVITKSIEAKSAADLPKLVEVLKMVSKEDPTIRIEINEETGENLISGMGELHLEVIENRMRTEKGIDVKTSTPIVVYRETVMRKSNETEGKTPNKHNRLYFTVEPMQEFMIEALKAGEIPEMRLRKKDIPVYDKLVTLGVAPKESRNFQEFYKGNALMDDTKGIVQIGEIMGLVMDGFEQVIDSGGLAGEPCTKMLVRLTDCSLHEDAIHRGPAQMYPAVRDGIRGAILDAKPALLEPIQIMQIETSSDYMGDISRLISNKRGQLLAMDQQGEHIIVKAAMPVAELFGWSSDLRSATSGRGSSFIVDQRFDKLPESLQAKVIGQIRSRKGMPAI